MNDKTTLLLLAVAAALLVVIFVFTPQVPVKRTDPSEEKFFPTTIDDTLKVELIGLRNELVLIKSVAGDWFMKQSPRKIKSTELTGEPKPQPAAKIATVADKADKKKVEELLGRILSLAPTAAPIRPKRGGVVENLESFGLASANRRIIVSYGKNVRRILNLGVAAPSGNALYCKYEDAPRVMFASKNAGRLLADATDAPQNYRNRELFKIKRLDGLAGIRLKVRDKMNLYAARGSNGLWALRMGKRLPPPAPRPMVDRASKEALGRLVEKFKSMRIESFEHDNLYVEAAGMLGLRELRPDKAKLSMLNLTPETAEYEVAFAKKSGASWFSLLIGRTVPYDPKLRFVRWFNPPYQIQGSKAGADVFEVLPQFHVFAVKGKFLNDLASALDGYRDKKLLPRDVNKVVRIEIAHAADSTVPLRTATQPATRPATLPALAYPNRPGRIVLVRDVGENDRLSERWTIESPAKAEADPGVVKNLLRGLRSMRALKFADGQNDRDLGLSPPAMRISLYEKDAKPPKATLLLSRPVGTRFFARMSQDSVARQFDATARDSVDLALLDLYQRKMVTSSLAKARSVTIQRPGKPKVIAVRLGTGRWFLQSPEKIHGGSNLQSLVVAMGNLKAGKAVADAPDDLAKYGLAEPALIVTVVEPREKKLIVTTQPETVKPTTLPDMLTYTVRIGNAVDDSTDVYAMIDGRSVVYRISSSILDAANKELRGNRVLADLANLQKKQVETIRLTRNNTTLQLDQFDGKWNAVSPKAFEAETKQVDEVAVRLIVLTGKAFTVVTDKAAMGLDKPVLQVEVGYRTSARANAFSVMATVGREFTVKEKGKDVKYRYVLTHKETVARHVKSDDLAELLRDYAAYMPKRMVKLDEKKAKAITLKRPGLTFTATRKDHNWTLIKPVETDAGWNISTMVRELTDLTAERVVADEPSDAQLEQFGLKNPAYVATLTIEAAKTPDAESQPAPKMLIVSIGKLVDAKKPDGNRYAMVSDKNRVYEVKAALIEKLSGMIRKDDIFGSWLSPQQITIERGGKKFALLKTSSGGVDSYEVEVDGAITTARKDDCKKFFEAFCGMKIDKYILQADDDSRLAEFGLDKSAIRVEVKGKDTVVVEVGKLTAATASRTIPDQRYYARRLGRPGVFLMKAEDVLKLEKPAADYQHEAATKPATRPATQPTTQPATQPTTQPATQPATALSSCSSWFRG